MSPCAALLLFLAIGLADPSSLNYDPDLDVTTAEITTITTEALPTKEPTTKAAPTTAAPTTAAPTTTATTTAAPTTTATTTAAPTTTAATTTEAPTTNATTTEAPTTNATTTEAPTTTATSPNTTLTPNTTSTAPPTTTPTPTLPSPTAHLYQVQKDNVICLLVKFGLRFGYQKDKYEEMNFEFINETTDVSGTCGDDSSELLITSDALILKLTFLNDTKKFSLHALNATGKTSSGVEFSETNNNLTLWQASLGNSYMCNKEQNYTITNKLTIFTFELQVQPFAVKKESFSTAQECSLDDTSILIPIVVGAALAGLILIVVIAYVIGRRKTYVGYQTL